ncbi:MAG TPA: hypothetical protein VFJ30_12115, partial [Phycisphaerae bacterium]|nr:hypothetical protein [Phycisphaerae bacterium]
MKTHRRIVLCLSALVAAAASAQAAPAVVARIKVHNPSKDALVGAVVRGALPLPAGYAKPVAALAVREGARVAPTQVSVFATYAGSDEKFPVGRPEVVQLAFRADLPAGKVSEFEVVELPKAPAGTEAAPGKALAALLSSKAAVVVEARDAFGNVYRCEPLAAAGLIETRQVGAVLTERLYQSILTPVGSAPEGKPALKRFLRVRAYLTTYAGEDAASLSLMIHNGSMDHPNSEVYYRDIRVGVAEAGEAKVWLKQFSPAADGKASRSDGYTWLPCPPAHPDGKLYVFPHGSAAVLRMTLCTPGARERALALCENAPRFVPAPSQELFSWSNFATARYGAPKYPMPLDLGPDAFARAGRAAAAQDSPTLNKLLAYLPAGDAGGLRTLGHAMPAHSPYGGVTGGGGILMVFGAEAAVTGNNAAIWDHVLLADRYWDRHHQHLFYDSDGKPFLIRRHLADTPAGEALEFPCEHLFRARVLRVEDPACKVHTQYVKAGDLQAPQAKQLLRYMDQDDQHLCRVFDAVPAAYLACDPVNRDRLVTLGTQACWKRNIYPYKDNPSAGGYRSLFELKAHADKAPHTGLFIGRAHG